MNTVTLAGLLQQCSKEEVQKYLSEILALTPFHANLEDKPVTNESQLKLDFQSEPLN